MKYFTSIFESTSSLFGSEKINMVIFRKLALAGVLLFSLSCSKTHDQPNIELIQNMMQTAAVKAQGADFSKDDFRANPVPPENTVARGKTPYAYPNDPDLAAKELVNPFLGHDDVLPRGKTMFLTFCTPCHGEQADGHGPVSKFWIAPIPALVSDNVKNFKDGYLFHMITMGRGLMSSYASQIPRAEDRWAIVNYLRELNKNQTK